MKEVGNLRNSLLIESRYSGPGLFLLVVLIRAHVYNFTSGTVLGGFATFFLTKIFVLFLSILIKLLLYFLANLIIYFLIIMCCDLSSL